MLIMLVGVHKKHRISENSMTESLPRITIIGATGDLGSGIAYKLAKAGYSVAGSAGAA
jgi:UDP-N-acetylmuramate-alanine ligase